VAVSVDRTHLRLAELVAALSLGIDLGFGQPMEHVLRQCLIASRLAERVGLDEQERADVYYTALLVNVGCHADAHEQAKWHILDTIAQLCRKPLDGVTHHLVQLDRDQPHMVESVLSSRRDFTLVDAVRLGVVGSCA